VGEVNGETEVRVGVGAGVEDTSTKHHLRVESFRVIPTPRWFPYTKTQLFSSDTSAEAERQL
jgi:hypothetical protein